MQIKKPWSWQVTQKYIGRLLVLVLLTGSAWAEQVLYVSTTQGNTVHVYGVNEDDGGLTERQTLALPHGIGPLALSPDGTRMYGAVLGARGQGRRQPSGIQAFARDPQTGQLALLTFTQTRGIPTYLDVTTSGAHVLAVYYGAGVAETYAVTENGIVPEAVSSIATDANAHACLLDEQNRFFVPHTGPNTIHQLAVDVESGEINRLDPPVVTAGPSREPSRKPVQGPRHYTHHPSLDIVYVVNELDCSVSAYRFDPEKGTLGERFQDLETMPKGFARNATCADIHVTPDGRFLYASTRGHNTIAAYSIDQSSGMMTQIGLFETEATPREFEIDLTGQYLYAAGQSTAALRAYRIDQTTGELKSFARYETGDRPSWVLATTVE